MWLQAQSSMKHPRQESGIQLWLEEQLHARGIDAAVYSKYILSVLSNESSRNSIKPKVGLHGYSYHNSSISQD